MKKQQVSLTEMSASYHKKMMIYVTKNKPNITAEELHQLELKTIPELHNVVTMSNNIESAKYVDLPELIQDYIKTVYQLYFVKNVEPKIQASVDELFYDKLNLDATQQISMNKLVFNLNQLFLAYTDTININLLSLHQYMFKSTLYRGNFFALFEQKYQMNPSQVKQFFSGDNLKMLSQIYVEVSLSYNATVEENNTIRIVWSTNHNKVIGYKLTEDSAKMNSVDQQALQEQFDLHKELLFGSVDYILDCVCAQLILIVAQNYSSVTNKEYLDENFKNMEFTLNGIMLSEITRPTIDENYFNMLIDEQFKKMFESPDVDDVADDDWVPTL